MKTAVPVQSCTAWSSGGIQQALDATAPTGGDSQLQPTVRSVRPLELAPDGNAERFREDLHRRSITPFRGESSNRHWGINE